MILAHIGSGLPFLSHVRCQPLLVVMLTMIQQAEKENSVSPTAMHRPSPSAYGSSCAFSARRLPTLLPKPGYRQPQLALAHMLPVGCVCCP